MSKPCSMCRGDGDAAINHCELIGYAVELRVCFNCSKNTAAGQWPTIESLPVVPTITAPPPDPIPFAQWPRVARGLYHLRRDGDKGVGDTITRLVTMTGAEHIAWWYTRITGHECGCADRQGKLNALYPYSADATQRKRRKGLGDRKRV